MPSQRQATKISLRAPAPDLFQLTLQELTDEKLAQLGEQYRIYKMTLVTKKPGNHYAKEKRKKIFTLNKLYTDLLDYLSEKKPSWHDTILARSAVKRHQQLLDRSRQFLKDWVKHQTPRATDHKPQPKFVPLCADVKENSSQQTQKQQYSYLLLANSLMRNPSHQESETHSPLQSHPISAQNARAK